VKVYLILNEAVVAADDSCVVTEVVHPAWSTRQLALDALAEIAADAGVTLEDDCDSLYLPLKSSYFSSDEYYVMETEII